MRIVDVECTKTNFADRTFAAMYADNLLKNSMIYKFKDEKKSDSLLKLFGDYNNEQDVFFSILVEHIRFVIEKSKTPLESNGHNTDAIYQYNNSLEDFGTRDAHMFMSYFMRDKVHLTQDIVIDVIQGNKALYSDSCITTECRHCGQDIEYRICGNLFSLGSSTCEPVGHYNTEVTFPSGKVFFMDYLGDIHANIEKTFSRKDENYGMRSAKSHHDISAMFARAGVYHVFAGNSCPGVYYDGRDHTIAFGSHGYTEDDNFDQTVSDLVSTGEKIGSICTDLWWVSMIDEVTLLKLYKRFYGARKGKKLFTLMAVDCERCEEVGYVQPGTYIGTSYHHMDHYPDDHSNKHLVATLQHQK